MYYFCCTTISFSAYSFFKLDMWGGEGRPLYLILYELIEYIKAWCQSSDQIRTPASFQVIHCHLITFHNFVRLRSSVNQREAHLSCPKTSKEKGFPPRCSEIRYNSSLMDLNLKLIYCTFSLIFLYIPSTFSKFSYLNSSPGTNIASQKNCRYTKTSSTPDNQIRNTITAWISFWTKKKNQHAIRFLQFLSTPCKHTFSFLTNQIY